MSDEKAVRERLEELLKTPYDTEGKVWQALLTAFVAEYEEIEQALNEALASKFVDTAGLAQLERLAEVYDLERRTGEPAADFRARVKTSLRAQITSGTLEEIVDMVAVLMDISRDEITVSEPEEETLTFETRIPRESLEGSSISRGLLPDLLNDVSAAGVNGIPVSLTVLELGRARGRRESASLETVIDDGYSATVVPGYSQGELRGLVLDTGTVIGAGDDVIARTIGPTTGIVIANGKPTTAATAVDDGYSAGSVPAYSEGGS